MPANAHGEGRGGGGGEPVLSQRLQGLRGAVHVAAAAAADAPHAPARSLIRRRRSLPRPRPRPPARPIGFLYQNRHERLTQTKGRAGGKGGGLAVGGDGTDNNNWAAVAQVERGLHSEISHLITCSYKIVVGTNICRVKGASACRAEAQTAQCDAFLLLLWTVHRDNDGDRGQRELGPPPWHWPFLPPSARAPRRSRRRPADLQWRWLARARSLDPNFRRRRRESLSFANLSSSRAGPIPSQLQSPNLPIQARPMAEVP